MVNELLPPVGQGILLSALLAALMSTVSSVLNSASTIWSVDVHKRLLHHSAGDEELVRIGRWSTFVIIVIATILAPLLLKWQGGIFIYIQDMAAFFAPPIAVIFLAAFLWPRAHGRAATFTLVFGILSGIALKVTGQTWGQDGIPWLKPLLNRAAVNWAICFIALIVATYLIPSDDRPYDKDAIWNPKWAKLPETEKSLNSGLRNLMFWWLVMVFVSVGLFVIFR
jgi:SSS family solute:Na+ symporter